MTEQQGVGLLVHQDQRHQGMGAIVYDGGVAFRVWAPNAWSVCVMGSFNNWSKTEHPLSTEGEGGFGYWYCDVPGAKAGDEYKFLITNGANSYERKDPYARQVTNSVGNGIIYDPRAFDWKDDHFELPPFNELVIYEMHVGSFTLDENGQGDFSDIEKKLKHLTTLGVNVIELMPVMEFAGDVSWGYNPAQIFAVESAYGGPDGLKQFIQTCHKHGLGVIIDVVYNHFGPSDLDLWQFDGWSENGKGGIYFYNDWRSETPWGDTRPDYGRGEVRQFIRDNAQMWIHEYHADGLRYDMTPYISSSHGGEFNIPEGWSLMHWINHEIRNEFPGKILIAEDLHSNPKVSDTGPDGAAFHAQWDAQFVHPIRKAVTEVDDQWRNIDAVAKAISYRYNIDSFERVIYTESHDEVANGSARVPEEIDPDDPTGYFAQKRSTAAAALLMTSPGIPMIFQGQEFLQGEWFRDNVPLDWDQDQEFRGIVRLYRDLIKLRRNVDASTAGLTGQYVNIYHRNQHDDVIAYHRYKDGGIGDDTVIVANLSAQDFDDYRIGLPFAGNWKLRMNSDASVYSAEFENSHSTDIVAAEVGYDGLQHSGVVSIGAYTVLIYSRED